MNAYVYRVFSRQGEHRRGEEKRSKAQRLARRKKWRELQRHYRRMWQGLKVKRGTTRRGKNVEKITRKRRKKRASSSSCRTCPLLLVADHSFFHGVGGGSIKQTVLQMLYHVREANLLLRRQDFDGDNVPDCPSRCPRSCSGLL